MNGPFDTQAYLQGANSDSFVLPENREFKRLKPRASSLNGCARAAAYMMEAAPETNKPRLDSVITQELGRIAEDYSKGVIAEIKSPLVEEGWEGLAIRNGWRTGGRSRQDALPSDFWATGHPDGDIHQRRFVHPSPPGSIGDRVNEYKETLADGLRWGWEHKVYGAYSYKKAVLADDVFTGLADATAQGLVYGAALEWDAVSITVLSSDASLIRGELTQARRYAESKNPVTADKWTKIVAKLETVNPKVEIFNVDLRPYKGNTTRLLQRRAEALTDTMATGTSGDDVFRERDPNTHPLCGYCPWLDRCQAAGQSKAIIIPASPLAEK